MPSAKVFPAGYAGDKPGSGKDRVGQDISGKKQAGASPFACVSAILGWDTFHMVHVLWIGLVDLPGKAPEKDWELQVTCCNYQKICDQQQLRACLMDLLPMSR